MARQGGDAAVDTLSTVQPSQHSQIKWEPGKQASDAGNRRHEQGEAAEQDDDLETLVPAQDLPLLLDQARRERAEDSIGGQDGSRLGIGKAGPFVDALEGPPEVVGRLVPLSGVGPRRGARRVVLGWWGGHDVGSKVRGRTAQKAAARIPRRRKIQDRHRPLTPREQPSHSREGRLVDHFKGGGGTRAMLVQDLLPELLQLLGRVEPRGVEARTH